MGEKRLTTVIIDYDVVYIEDRRQNYIKIHKIHRV